MSDLALLEADVIDRVHFNENFRCQHGKVNSVYRQALLALASLISQSKRSVITIIFAISRDQYEMYTNPKDFMTIHSITVFLRPLHVATCTF